MSFLLFSIATSIILFFFTKSYIFFSIIFLGLYYLKRDNTKLQSLLSLTFVLMIALSFFSTIRGYNPSGLLFLLIATFSSIIYDILKKPMWSLPFFAFLGIGISMIGTIKYGNLGYLFGFLIIPIFLREFKKRGEKN
ncbi:hypothetical protein SU69_00855 [Thermosipho melanesiensis]|uniref:Uncharacterized protein n=2 Tax=Thermosipho melanesiensis TaxID=46541 RepID=A6LJD5_THEM4|nr:hypothetical protein [Thermosipho melanesiensis]ABR30036.1 hypothetical protein Tmel_0159 [Thermosipho melanesiensis BI429]APT73237.1 hypothetical protein BW47_00880 [Thermosipho melanesiensis]OOC38630.1 hypothetical protein SU68_00855 [Thermosipho melanesiensis]OOC40434.1 hypothetical protein SU70_00855 [Thermosipho melanesiensis]OOC40699.1 hypothetical protein SU69_00855 [Thermosipho melanesiensis]